MFMFAAVRSTIAAAALVGVIGSMLTACTPGPDAAAASTADQEWVVHGLERPGEILIDRWGVPHIYAETHYDAFFLQGFARGPGPAVADRYLAASRPR
jgi:penicillin G amidase